MNTAPADVSFEKAMFDRNDAHRGRLTPREVRALAEGRRLYLYPDVAGIPVGPPGMARAVGAAAVTSKLRVSGATAAAPGLRSCPLEAACAHTQGGRWRLEVSSGSRAAR